MLEKALRAMLLEDATVAALVGARIYRSPLPQAPTLPAISYQRIAKTGDLDLEGPGAPKRVRVQWDSWATTLEQARAVALAVEGVLHGCRARREGQEIQSGRLELERGDEYDAEGKAFRVSADFVFMAKEEVVA